MSLKRFLNDRAQAVASTPLVPAAGAAALARWQDSQRTEILQEWGLSQRMVEREVPPSVVVTGEIESDDFSIKRLWFEASPGLVITGNLYVPRDLIAPAPAIIYLCGHHPQQKVWYQDHARRFAQLGMVTLILDTLRNDELPGVHHGTYNMGAFNWFSRGYSPAAAEAWAALRAYDLLAARDDVDAARVGVTGHSGGGAVSWYAAALEPRIAAVVSSSGTGGEDSHIIDRTLDGHCDCYFPANPSGRSIAELYALVAPRPTLILAPRHDAVYTVGSVERIHERLLSWYRRCTGENWPIELFVFDADHSYTPASRRAAFGWMMAHLADAGGTSPADLDAHRERPEDLRVLQSGAAPSEQRNASVQDWLLPARAPAPTDRGTLADQIVRQCLRFADLSEPVAVQTQRHYERQGLERVDFTWVTEHGWRLRGCWLRPLTAGRHADDTVEVVLRPRDADGRWLPATLDPERASSQVVLDVRGTGETAWHPALDWHLRRASGVLGRTIGAMRLLDVLTGLEATRAMTGARQFTLTGDGELSVSALVAGVIDPTVTSVLATGLPESLDRADTAGDPCPPAWEIGHLLQVADIADLLRVMPLV